MGLEAKVAGATASEVAVLGKYAAWQTVLYETKQMPCTPSCNYSCTNCSGGCRTCSGGSCGSICS